MPVTSYTYFVGGYKNFWIPHADPISCDLSLTVTMGSGSAYPSGVVYSLYVRTFSISTSNLDLVG